MRTTTNFEEFMSYVDWNELDINEKRALVEAARSTTNLDLGLFRTELQSELKDKTIVWYPLGNIGLVLDIPSRANYIKYLENNYMHGEDVDSYLSWLESTEDSEDSQIIKAQAHSLSTKQIVYVKKINLENNYFSDNVCYARRISNTYRITPDQETKNNPFFFGYSEHEYPCDDLDNAIMQKIQNKFPNATCQTSLMMFDIEKENLKHWAGQLRKQTYNVRIEYIPSNPNLMSQAQVCNKAIDVIYIPTHNHPFDSLNSDIVVVTQSLQDFMRLRSLLDNTYIPFSEIIK